MWMCVQGGSSESSGDSSSSDSESSSDESLQFDDGLDEDLVGDEEDRSKLSNMTDIEREQEMYMRCAVSLLTCWTLLLRDLVHIMMHCNLH